MSLFALSAEPPDDQRALAARLAGRVAFLSDPSGASLDALGLRDTRGAPWYDRWFFGARKGDIAMPATLLVARDGKVAFVHRSRRIDDRPTVAAILDNIPK